MPSKPIHPVFFLISVSGTSILQFISSLFITSTSNSLLNIAGFNFKIYLKFDYLLLPLIMFRSLSLLSYNNILLTDCFTSAFQLTLNTQKCISRVILLKHKSEMMVSHFTLVAFCLHQVNSVLPYSVYFSQTIFSLLIFGTCQACFLFSI